MSLDHERLVVVSSGRRLDMSDDPRAVRTLYTPMDCRRAVHRPPCHTPWCLPVARLHRSRYSASSRISNRLRTWYRGTSTRTYGRVPRVPLLPPVLHKLHMLHLLASRLPHVHASNATTRYRARARGTYRMISSSQKSISMQSFRASRRAADRSTQQQSARLPCVAGRVRAFR